MRPRTAFLSFLVIAPPSLATALPQEIGHVLRNGDAATLTVFDGRPLDAAATLLAREFGLQVNVEDPLYFYRDDLEEVTAQISRVPNPPKRTFVPRRRLLELAFDLAPDGSPRDARGLLQAFADAANAQSPFAYRIDRGDDAFSLVATRTKDEQGRVVAMTPILDRHVTIPLGTRRFYEHVNLLTHALEEQTGVHMVCCSAGAPSQPGPPIAFGADNELARSALLRLIRSLPVRNHVARSQSGGYHLLPSEPAGHYWSMRCQPLESLCFVNVARIPDKGAEKPKGRAPN